MSGLIAKVITTKHTFNGHDYTIIGDIQADKAVSIADATDEDLGSIVIESCTEEYYEVYDSEGECVNQMHVNAIGKRTELYDWAIASITHN